MEIEKDYLSSENIRKLFCRLLSENPGATNKELCKMIETETRLDFITIVTVLKDLPEYLQNGCSEPRRVDEDKDKDKDR